MGVLVEISVSPSVQIPFCQRCKSQPQNGITTSVEANQKSSLGRITRTKKRHY